MQSRAGLLTRFSSEHLIGQAGFHKLHVLALIILATKFKHLASARQLYHIMKASISGEPGSGDRKDLRSS